MTVTILTAWVAVAAMCAAGTAVAAMRLRARPGRSRDAGARAGAQRPEPDRTAEDHGRFVAGAAHELRTPLTAVIGFTDLVLDGRAGSLNRHQREYLDVVRTSAGHLLRLVDELLDTASAEAGHIRLEPEPVLPAAIARECVTSMRPLARERRIHLDCLAPSLGAALLDPARLRQVIVNLLSNALKFTDAGGRVTLRVTRQAQRLVISVSDTGIGIAPEDRERIFEEFVRLGGRERAGSGLGLALTRRIVRAQGGDVAVSSRPGAGSTFTAWLPWVAAEVAPTPARSDWDAVLAGMAIGDPRAPELAVGERPPRPGRAAERPWPFTPEGARRAPGAADGASRPTTARAQRP